jgi:hypothetical protein
MSDDEALVAVLSGVLAIAFWGGWLSTAAEAYSNPLARPGRQIAGVAIVLLIAPAIIVVALLTGADPQVRSGTAYIFLFLAVAADTLALATVAGTTFGLSALDGFIRLKNAAIGWAVTGLWLGTALVNAGANIGRGDTIYTTLGPLALAFVALLALAAILAAATRGFRAIRLDRDSPTGIRVAGLFVAWGLILGRAVAGDWESTRQTWEDFVAYCWPVLALLIAAVPVEWALRPTVRRPRTSWAMGLVPAAVYVAAAVVWVVLR